MRRVVAGAVVAEVQAAVVRVAAVALDHKVRAVALAALTAHAAVVHAVAVPMHAAGVAVRRPARVASVRASSRRRSRVSGAARTVS